MSDGGERGSELKVVIFDFDGTLADVIPMMRKIYAEMAVKRGFPEVTDEKFKELQKGSLKAAIKWIGVKPWQLASVMNEGRKLFYKHRKDVMLFPGVKDLIHSLHKEGWEIYILSSNSHETIRSVLRREGIAEHITILKRPPLFGKASSIKKLVRRHRLDLDSVYMVGDEVRDIDAANKARVRGIAVSWGLQHQLVLKEAKPYLIANTVAELKAALQ